MVDNEYMALFRFICHIESEIKEGTMEARRLTVYEVLQEGFNKIFKHFLSCLKGLFGVALVGFITLAILVLVNWSWAAHIIRQAPEIMEQAKACGENGACIKALFWPLISPHLFMFVISACIAILVLAWISLGMVRYFLNVHDSGNASIKDLFLPIGKAAKLIITSMLFSLIILSGLVLLVIPGIYWGIRFGQFQYFIIDKDAGIIESLKMSWAATNGYGWQIFFLALIINGIAWVANMFVPLILITIPLQFIVYACIYRKLTSSHRETDQKIAQA